MKLYTINYRKKLQIRKKYMKLGYGLSTHLRFRLYAPMNVSLFKKLHVFCVFVFRFTNLLRLNTHYNSASFKH